MEPRSLNLVFNRAEANLEERTVPLSISSDTKDILRRVAGHGIGYEVLQHDSPNNINLKRFSGPNGGPLLLDHDPTQIVGRFFPTDLSGGTLRGLAKFGKSAKSEEVYQDVLDGIRTDTSISYDYSPDAVVEDTSVSREYPTYLVKRWNLTEASLVGVPADVNTGVGRSEEEVTTVTVSETEDSAEVPEGCSVEGCTPETPCPDCLSRCSSEPRSAAPAASTPTIMATHGRMEIQMEPIIATDVANDISQALQLRAIADQHGKGREAAEILSSKTLPEARAEIMKLLSTTPVSSYASLEDMGASKKERKEFSYVRLLAADVARRENKHYDNCAELEISESIRKGMPATFESRGGVMVPFAINNSRAEAPTVLTSNTSGSASQLVYTQFGNEIIEVLRNTLKVAALGATYLGGLPSPISFPRQLTSAAATWVNENAGSDAALSLFTTDTVTLTPKTLIGNTLISRQLLALGVVNAEAMIRQDLAYSVQAAIDLKAITTLYASSAVNSVDVSTITSGTPDVRVLHMPDYADYVSAVAKVAAANALMGGAGFLANPTVASAGLTTLEFATNGSGKLWTGNIEEGQIAGYRALSTNQMPSNLGTDTNEFAILFGAWKELLIGGFGSGMEIQSDPYKYAAQGLLAVTSFSMADVAIRHEKSFTKFVGVGV